ncbi:VHS [Lasallia pustulata]|uniref:VHS n=1 Tax=Lasallia pustulata TaxID=136370 RepID=A0A1W5D614_9LECA|nr:VHS [Lasallia pustulata]
MRRLLGSINKRGSQDESSVPIQDSPEANAARGVRLFCESGGPNNSGEEVLHLPVIVEAAESSPSAAREAANVIRKFLSKDNYQRPYVQYNSIMLVRILADNPGMTFTRNIDSKFVITVKELLRDGRDMSVQQMLRETLDTFETQKPNDETLKPLIAMWQKEKSKTGNRSNAPPMPPRTLHAPPYNPNQQQNYFARNHRPRGLPPPHELVQRIEEAKTSAKLLSQVVQSTPPSEILSNELIKEFAERCQSASRSIQGYIHSEDPPPDDATLLTLIETNDQLSQATSRHQHALLQARRVAGAAPMAPSPPAGPPYGQPSQNGRMPYAAPQAQYAAPPPNLPARTEPQYAQQPGQYPPPAETYTAPPGPPPRKEVPQHSHTSRDPLEDHAAVDRSSQVLQAPFDHHAFGAVSPPPGPPPSHTRAEELSPLPQSNASYHPGYQATPSYLQRQDSATNHYTMHGVEGAGEPVSPVEALRPVQYRF